MPTNRAPAANTTGIQAISPETINPPAPAAAGVALGARAEELALPVAFEAPDDPVADAVEFLGLPETVELEPADGTLLTTGAAEAPLAAATPLAAEAPAAPETAADAPAAPAEALGALTPDADSSWRGTRDANERLARMPTAKICVKRVILVVEVARLVGSRSKLSRMSERVDNWVEYLLLGENV